MVRWHAARARLRGHHSALITIFLASTLVTAAPIRGAQDADKNRLLAEKLVAEGEELRSKQEKEFLRQAIEKFEQSIPLWQAVGDRAAEAAVLNTLGAIHQSMGNNRRALELLEQTLTLRRALGDDAQTAQTLSVIAAVYQSLGEMERAIDSYHESLRLARAVGDRRRESRALNGIGRIYDSGGEYERAVDAYTQALELARAAGDRLTEASVTGNLGRLHQMAGESQKALDHFRRALVLFQELDDRRLQTTAIHTIGAVYHSLGDTSRAIGFYEEALRLARALGNRQAMTETLNTLAIAHSASGAHRPALQLLDEALPLAREVGNPRLVASTLHNIGDVHRAMGEQQKALEYQMKALSLRRTLRDRAGEARVLIEIGSIYYALGERERALKSYNEALPITRDLKDRPGEALALIGLAHLERDAGDLDATRAQVEAALDLIERLRSNISINELRTSYLAGKQKEYEFYIDLLMQLHESRPTEGFDAAALRASERARARSLLELLIEGRSEIRQGADAALLERMRSLQQRLNAKAERQIRLLAEPNIGGQAAAAAKELDALTTELHELEGQIRTKSPRYAALTQPQPLTVREIQEQVLDADTLLLEYSLGEERSYLWAVSQSTLISHELPRRGEIESAARRVYDLLTARQAGIGRTRGPNGARASDLDAQYWREAARLSQMLLGPAASQLGAKRLLIVGAEALQYIPFAALPEPEGSGPDVPASSRKHSRFRTPLIVDHEIISLPSASTLAVLRRELAGRQPAAHAVAVLADPVFDAQDERVRQVARTGGSPVSSTDHSVSDLTRAAEGVGAGGRLTRLPFTRREAEGILSLAPSGGILKAIDFQASRETATSDQLRNYRIVHLATHGFLNGEHPDLSGIVLSLVDQQGSPQDGFLRLHDLYNLNLPAELVVLSACQSALGKTVKGEGLVGLTRGFMYAGAARVLASLWKVDDVATAEFMRRFYEGVLGRGLSPAAALRAAQVAMWKQKRWTAPYYWAAFVLQGEWQGWTTSKPTQ